MSVLDYSTIGAVNPSSLKILLRKSPLHYQYSLTHPREETAAMRLGTAVHLAVLQPDLFAAGYVAKPAGMKFNTKEGIAWRDAQTRVILDADDYDNVYAMAEAVLSSPAAQPFLAPGQVEAPILWTDAATGIACKGKPDLVTGTGILTDLKTARDLTPRRFTAACLDLGYLFSMAMYADGLAANGREPGDVALVCVESVAPFDVVVYRLDAEALDVGREEYRRALETLKVCRETGRWPGQSPDPVTLTLPTWAYPEDDDAEGLDFGQEG